MHETECMLARYNSSFSKLSLTAMYQLVSPSGCGSIIESRLGVKQAIIAEIKHSLHSFEIIELCGVQLGAYEY